jgi:hypothetical protein
VVEDYAGLGGLSAFAMPPGTVSVCDEAIETDSAKDGCEANQSKPLWTVATFVRRQRSAGSDFHLHAVVESFAEAEGHNREPHDRNGVIISGKRRTNTTPMAMAKFHHLCISSRPFTRRFRWAMLAVLSTRERRDPPLITTGRDLPTTRRWGGASVTNSIHIRNPFGLLRPSRQRYRAQWQQKGALSWREGGQLSNARYPLGVNGSARPCRTTLPVGKVVPTHRPRGHITRPPPPRSAPSDVPQTPSGAKPASIRPRCAPIAWATRRASSSVSTLACIASVSVARLYT